MKVKWRNCHNHYFLQCCSNWATPKYVNCMAHNCIHRKHMIFCWRARAFLMWYLSQDTYMKIFGIESYQFPIAIALISVYKAIYKWPTHRTFGTENRTVHKTLTIFSLYFFQNLFNIWCVKIINVFIRPFENEISGSRFAVYVLGRFHHGISIQVLCNKVFYFTNCCYLDQCCTCRPVFHDTYNRNVVSRKKTE